MIRFLRIVLLTHDGRLVINLLILPEVLHVLQLGEVILVQSRITILLTLHLEVQDVGVLIRQCHGNVGSEHIHLEQFSLGGGADVIINLIQGVVTVHLGSGLQDFHIDSTTLLGIFASRLILQHILIVIGMAVVSRYGLFELVSQQQVQTQQATVNMNRSFLLNIEQTIVVVSTVGGYVVLCIVGKTSATSLVSNGTTCGTITPDAISTC